MQLVSFPHTLISKSALELLAMAILSNFTNFTINRIIIVSTVALALSVKNSLQIPLKDFLTLTFQQKESLEQVR